jgi:diacylglycerol kinase family enzyme
VEAQVLPAHSGEELVALTRRAARDKPPVVVAGGGDGTISSVASVLAGTGIALGVLPMGTLNHFAKDLGVSLDLEQAARDIAACHTTQVDVGEVNGRVFVNNSSLGLYPQIVHQREKQRSRLGRGKWRAMLWATLLTLRRYPFLDVRLRLDRTVKPQRTPFVFIGNNEYKMEGFDIGKRERLDGGILSVYTTQPIRRLGLLALAMRALFGRLRQVKDFETHEVKRVRIETRRRRQRMLVAIDGEVAAMDMPLEYRIRPGALRVIVPATRAG